MDWDKLALSKRFEAAADSSDVYVRENQRRVANHDSRSGAAKMMIDEYTARADLMRRLAASSALESQELFLRELKAMKERADHFVVARGVHDTARYRTAWERECEHLIAEFDIKDSGSRS
jgi:hypothetical protein